MNRYNNLTPRATFGVAAVVMAALTLSLSVVVPATMDTHRPAASKANTPGSIEADIVPPRIDVFGVREPKMISMQPQVVQSTIKEQG